jgi:acetolactate synthase-1/2/3 large subunit
VTDIPGINPNTCMHALSRHSDDASTYVVDVGQHQMWAAESLDLQPGQRLLTSGGMGSMGFALPAAIGAATATGKPVVAIAGDGGFQCNIQELQTVARNHLPVRVVVIDNQCLGMVRQFQESYFEGRYQSTMWGYSAPDFVRIAESYGIPARAIEALRKSMPRPHG